jgi:hypothetical protein
LHTDRFWGSAGVSETVSERPEKVVKNSVELGHILLEKPMKPAILLALNRRV